MRYFYTDPLAAAWQSKHFGVNLYQEAHVPMVNYKNGEKSISLHQFPLQTWETINIKEDGIRLYISPDSLRLLEPRQGDIVEHDGIEYGIVLDVIDGEAGIQYSENENGETLCGTANIEDLIIIQRQGKPFFWPGVEE